jgi:hypothetical protein
MVEPTKDEAATFLSLDDVLKWCRFPAAGEVMYDSFVALLGADPSDPPAPLALVSEQDWAVLVSAWKLGTAAPTIMQAAKAGLVGRALRIGFGMQPRASDVAAASSAALALSSAGVPSVGASQASSSALALTPRKVKLAMVVDQTSDEDAPILTEMLIQAAYATYDATMGGEPPDDCEPSVDQLTAIHWMVFIAKMLPYVDFGVFGPHSVRMIRKLKLTGMVLSASGQLHHAEMSGPSSFEQWDSCAAVLRVAFIMLRITTHSGFDRYRNHIKQYAGRYGADCWPLIYQADVRARRELAERVRRNLAREGKLLINGLPVAMQWDLVYRALPDEFGFWKREVEDPSILIITKALNKSADSIVSGEAPIVTRNADHISGPDGAVHDSKTHVKHGQSPAKRPKHDQQGNQVNKRGAKLCPGFQNGTCNEMPCPDGLKHQCSVCLDNRHGSSGHVDKPHGGGKGKGKHKGKKGKGKW